MLKRICLHFISVITVIVTLLAATFAVHAADESTIAKQGLPSQTVPGKLVTDLSLSELFEELDYILAHADLYEREKESRIASLRSELALTGDREQRYWLARSLHNEFYSYDSDSALYYADMAISLAREAGRLAWVDEMTISRAYVLAATGMLQESDEALHTIDLHLMPPELGPRYAEQVIFNSTHRAHFMGGNIDESIGNDHIRHFLDSVCSELPKDDPSFGWLTGWKNFSWEQYSDSTMRHLEESLRLSSFNSRKDAKNAWMLGTIYERQGNYEQHYRWFALSAIADIHFANKEIASLGSLAWDLYQGLPGYDGKDRNELVRTSLKRANKYIHYAIIATNRYKCRTRVGTYADIQNQISDAYQNSLQKEQRRASTYLTLALCMVAALFVACILIVIQMRRNRRSKLDIDRANSALSEKVAELENVRRQLEENNTDLEDRYSSAREGALSLSITNFEQEKYIADIFSICSGYISKLDDFRKNIYRLLVARKFDELMRLTKTSEFPLAESRELHHTFDRIFLGLYPNFVENFNSLLRPEERITPRTPGVLSTELRIYALVRLGLSDSTSIARFLHCSVQTVYNTRQRTRAKSLYPREEFLARVRTLGAPPSLR